MFVKGGLTQKLKIKYTNKIIFLGPKPVFNFSDQFQGQPLENGWGRQPSLALLFSSLILLVSAQFFLVSLLAHYYPNPWNQRNGYPSLPPPKPCHMVHPPFPHPSRVTWFSKMERGTQAVTTSGSTVCAYQEYSKAG